MRVKRRSRCQYVLTHADHRSSFVAIVEQEKNLTALMKEYGDGMSDSLSTSLLSTWLLRVGDVSTKMANLELELVCAFSLSLFLSS